MVDFQMTLHHSFDSEFALGTRASGQAHATAEIWILDEQPYRRRQRCRISRWHEQSVFTGMHYFPTTGCISGDYRTTGGARLHQRLRRPLAV
jgi:hypothetical protein